MRASLLLLLHSLKRLRALVFTTGLVLCGFQVILIVVGRSIHRSGGFEQLTALLPPFARELMGPSIGGFMSFAGIVCFGYFHPAVLASLVAISIALATGPTSEIESGFMDLILSRPLARHWIITRTIASILLSTLLLLGLMMAGTWTGLAALAPEKVRQPSSNLILELALNLGLVMVCWSGVAMAIGAASRRRSVAGALGGLLALLAFLLDYVARLWKPAESIAWLSPFHYHRPFDLLMGKPLPWNHLAVLGGIALAGYAAAYVLFARRDISH